MAIAPGEIRNGPCRSQPVLWWELINQAEALSLRYSIGLASVWQRIHQNDYEQARTELDAVARAWACSDVETS